MERPGKKNKIKNESPREIRKHKNMQSGFFMPCQAGG